MNQQTCGYVALIGRPNVGKSTLLNRLLEKKISITSRKPQTTRHKILGIKTTGNTQTIFVDTPGLHQTGKRAINRYMNRAAMAALKDVDVIVFVVEGRHWKKEDDWVLTLIEKAKCPVVLAVNKVDRIKPKSALLPLLQSLNDKYSFYDIVPISAKTGEQVAQLEQLIVKLLPAGPHFYAEDQITDRSERFLVAEIIREKLVRLLGEELPYATAVAIDQFTIKKKIIAIDATIWVERPGQKVIVIGKAGAKLKEIGQTARLDIEKLLGNKVFLQLWVKVKTNWSDNNRLLEDLMR